MGLKKILSKIVFVIYCGIVYSIVLMAVVAYLYVMFNGMLFILED